MPRARVVTPEERLNGKAGLLTLVKPGQTLYTLVKHTHAQDEWRSVSLFVVNDGALRSVTNLVGQALGLNVDRYGGIRWETQYHLVARLCMELYGDYKSINQENIE